MIVEGGWRNRISDPVMAKLGIPVMRTWNLTVPLWEYHHGFQVGHNPVHLDRSGGQSGQHPSLNNVVMLLCKQSLCCLDH